MPFGVEYGAQVQSANEAAAVDAEKSRMIKFAIIALALYFIFLR